MGMAQLIMGKCWAAGRCWRSIQKKNDRAVQRSRDYTDHHLHRVMGLGQLREWAHSPGGHVLIFCTRAMRGPPLFGVRRELDVRPTVYQTAALTTEPLTSTPSTPSTPTVYQTAALTTEPLTSTPSTPTVYQTAALTTEPLTSTPSTPSTPNGCSNH